MNKKGQLGFAFLVLALVFILGLFALIEPFKEQLDTNRDGVGDNTGLNCPGTPNHDPTDYANDTDFEQLVRRPTCFVTGISFLWFMSAFMLAVVTWTVRNWGRLKK